jgi:Na+-translocating ferredoxin:NAD+ oxidoreductase subunit C
MIKLPENKHLTDHKPIEQLPPPQKAYIPLSQHLGALCDLLDVRPGDVVQKGQRLATANAKVFAPVHSSISGKVVGIQNWPHPLLGRCRAVVVESDGLDTAQGLKSRPEEEINRLTPHQIRQIVMDTGIVGLGGAAFPTHLKLNPIKPVDTLIINCAECEPYLTADFRLMVEKTREVILGIKVVARCLNINKIIIAVEDNKPQAIECFSKECASEPQITVKVLKSFYPQGGEKTLIKNILGKEVPSGKLPFDIGVVVHNVGTIYAIYEAVYKNKPLYERVVTVSGSCLENPKNLLVRIGTPIKDLIAACGPLKEEPVKIIFGGPMMGLAQYTDQVPVIKSTTGIVLFNKKEAETFQESACIRCGACIRVCSQGQMPCMMNLAAEKEMWDDAASFGVLDCVECGSCSYVCPANRYLVQSIKRAKLALALKKETKKP